MSDLLTPNKSIIDPSPFGWFRSKVRLALDLYKKIYPARADELRKLAKMRRDTARTPKALWGEKEDYVLGIMPKFFLVALGLNEATTNHLYGCACGSGVKNWDLDDDLHRVFWEEARDLRISSYEGMPEMAKRTGNTNGV